MKHVEMIRAHMTASFRHAFQRVRYYISTLDGGQPEVVDLLTGEAGLDALQTVVEAGMACLGECTELGADSTNGSSATRRAVRKGLRTRGARAHADNGTEP